MPLVPVYTAARGVVKDLSPIELPPELWSEAVNVRFQNKRVKVIGARESAMGTLSGTPEHLVYVPSPAGDYWVYCTSDGIYAWDGATHTEISSTTYTSEKWSSALLAGTLVVNNPNDGLFEWVYPPAATAVVAISVSPAFTCQFIRDFRNFIFAFDITESATRFPQMIRWSEPVDPGAVPGSASWDYTDPTLQAGKLTLGDIPSPIVEAQQLRDVLVIYQETAAWLCRFVGGTFIFRFDRVLTDMGALGLHCVTAFNNGTQHFVVTRDDIVLFDGQNAQSIAQDRVRTKIFSELNLEAKEECFVVQHRKKNEIWFCYPANGAQKCNVAAVWNFVENAWSFTDIQDFTCAGRGFYTEESATGTYVTVTGTYANTTATYQEFLLDVAFTDGDLLFGTNNGKVLREGAGFGWEGNDFFWYVRREGLAIAGQDRSGAPKVDYAMNKMISEIWPEAVGGEFTCRIGDQRLPDAPVEWIQSVTFNSRYPYKCDFFLNSKLFAIEFSGLWSGQGELGGYKINVNPAGMY